MKIEEISIEKIIEYGTNPRRNDHVVPKMAKAIKEFGFKIPILLKPNNELIDGHLRLKAAKSLKLKTVPAIYVQDLSDQQMRALRISINKLSEVAEWDTDLLKLEFKKLENFDLSLTGFEEFEIETINQEFEIQKASLDDQSHFLTDNESNGKSTQCPKCGHVFK